MEASEFFFLFFNSLKTRSIYAAVTLFSFCLIFRIFLQETKNSKNRKYKKVEKNIATSVLQCLVNITLQRLYLLETVLVIFTLDTVLPSQTI